jgi:hypothetical protein
MILYVYNYIYIMREKNKTKNIFRDNISQN